MNITVKTKNRKIKTSETNSSVCLPKMQLCRSTSNGFSPGSSRTQVSTVFITLLVYDTSNDDEGYLLHHAIGSFRHSSTEALQSDARIVKKSKMTATHTLSCGDLPCDRATARSYWSLVE
jgi:hypothetical protein